MKKKPPADPIIAPEILGVTESDSSRSSRAARAAAVKRCAVCDGICSPASSMQGIDDEELCWVCRRLKISAWRESEQPVAQE